MLVRLRPARVRWLALLALATFNAGCPQLLDDDFTALEIRAPDAHSGDLPEPTDPAADGSADESNEGSGYYSGWSSSGRNDWTNDGGQGSQWRDTDWGSEEPTAACVASTERCDGLDNDCDGTVDQGTTCPADCTGVLILGRGHMFCGGSGAIAAVADVRCKDEGLQLVWIDSAAENAALLEAAPALHASLTQLDETQGAIWIGAQDLTLEGSWRWGLAGPIFWLGAANGTAQDGAYQNWAPGRPNDNAAGTGEDCGLLYIATGSEPIGTWNDVDCTEAHAYVCEPTDN